MSTNRILDSVEYSRKQWPGHDEVRQEVEVIVYEEDSSVERPHGKLAIENAKWIVLTETPGAVERISLVRIEGPMGDPPYRLVTLDVAFIQEF